MQISAISSGVSGLQSAQTQLDRAAVETANANVPVDRVTLSGADPMIQATADRLSGEAAYRANLKTIQTADQMSGVLLELLTRR